MQARLPRQLSIGLLGLLLLCEPLRADPLDNWTWLYPRSQGNTLRAVTYGNGLFVAVGDYGTIITSSDGYHWKNRSYGKYPTLLGVAYANGAYVAVGEGGTILSSTNGDVWAQRTSPTGNTLRAATGDPGLSPNPAGFLAVGDFGAAVSSPDSLAWTLQNPGVTNRLNGLAFNVGTFRVVGDNGTIRRYDPLSGWSPGASPGPTNYLQSIAVGNGIYTIGGSIQIYSGGPYSQLTYAEGEILASRSFLRWTNVGATAYCPKTWFTINGIAFGNDRFVAVGYTAFTLEFVYPGIVMTSNDGTNWTALPSQTSENSLYGVTYGNGLFVAVGDGGSILVSSNGSSWNDTTGYHRTAITAIASSGSFCIASGQPIRHYYWTSPDFSTLVSSNGQEWVVSTTDLPPMNDLIAIGSLFIGVSGGCIYTTTDGYVWASKCVSTNELRGVGYGKGRFFVVGDRGTIYASSDASNWNNYSMAGGSNFNCAAYGRGLYVAAGAVTAMSADGVSWSPCPTNPPANLKRILCANGMFMAAGDSGYPAYTGGRILTSADGTNWVVRYTPGGSAPALAYGSGAFLAVTGTTMHKSPDGIHWIPSTTSLPWLWNEWIIYYSYPIDRPPPIVQAYQGTFLIGGMNGILMRSGDVRVPILQSSPRMTALGFGFLFQPGDGDPYRIQTSTDLDVWENLYTAAGSQNPEQFIDVTTGNSQRRFFRVVSP